DENGKEHILVDGWLVNPLPFNAARDLGAELVIGVDVLRGTTKMVPLYFVPRKQKTWHLLAVIYDIFEMMQQQLTRLHMQEGDVLLTPTMGSIRAIDFKKVDDAIRVGREEVMENAKAILAAIGEDPKH
ncbi:MAG: hypothetical protein HYS57_02705, partial [Parcubacteria group bacterium]|nr:hypothetical protein [Parcubacteria group bacterium]